MCQPSTVKNLDFVASKFGDFLQTFQARYKKGFGFASPGRDIINDGGRVGGIELSGIEDHALVTSSGKPPHVEKERLDFSCAHFGPDGGLVSNAPHIPGHLGAI
ncbi:uncharacterized protein LOC143453407 isoform X1 [Clavelina lepadiformis]|uniref:uncharacterized protein LOC143453407 isoform X1 n=1 Tax=Clavelina lepadiformis TaxID=159417 RepID=UPI004041898B